MTIRERTGRKRLLVLVGLALLAVLLLVPFVPVRDVPDLRDAPATPHAPPSRVSAHAESQPGASPPSEPAHDAHDARRAAACAFTVRIVTALAREPIADVPVQVHAANAPPATAITGADGRVEVAVPRTTAGVRVVAEWGAEWPSHDFAAPDGGAGVTWDAGDVAVASTRLAVRVEIDPVAATLVAEDRVELLRVQLVPGRGDLASATVARTTGTLRVIDIRYEEMRGRLERVAWLDDEGPVDARASLHLEATNTPSWFAQRTVRRARPGHYEPLVVPLHGDRFVRGTVTWNAGTPASGIELAAWGDRAATVTNGRSDAHGRFCFVTAGAATGSLKGRVGAASFAQPYVLGADNRVVLPVDRGSLVMARVVGADGAPVVRAGLFQLNDITRDEAGAFVRDEAFFRRRTCLVPDGVHYLAVRGIAAGERWYAVTHAHGEVAFTFPRAVGPGEIADVPAAGNGAQARPVRLELPKLDPGDESMLTLRERSPRGDPGARIWLRCKQAFLRAQVDVEHVYPGTYELSVNGRPEIVLPPLVVE
jgi:hypothetical protein